MIAKDAPDPRDILWSNVGVDLVMMENRKFFVQPILLLGIFGWAYFIDAIHKNMSKEVDYGSSLLEDDQSVQKGCELIRFRRLTYAKLYDQSSPLTSILQSCLSCWWLSS